MQRLALSTAEFLGSNGPARVKKCREFAVEASKTAACAVNSGTENAYLELARQWNELADEIEKTDELKAGLNE